MPSVRNESPEDIELPHKPSGQFLIVTGMSGAGRSTCLKILEDLDFEAVDNLPLPLLHRLLATETAFEGNLAIGLDTRTIGFDPDEIMAILTRVDERPDLEPKLIFCDCADDVIQQRYSESRRPHPMSPDRGVADGIAMERQLMGSLRRRADILLDTTEMTQRMLAQRLNAIFSGHEETNLALTVMSFAYRHGLPRDADLVFDVRFLRNPHYEPTLKHATGLDKPVADYIREDDGFDNFSKHVFDLILPLLPRYRREGKSYLTIAFGCTGGQHRSVFMSEWLTSQLRLEGWTVMTVHREIEAKRISDAPKV